ncbi:hypothetical protein F5Y16DRAFT_403753 [Xylariaceae sp. FL0255]|nr:hypothetical protein F5Y16DRAFT_403753 [Xylariaceae sp. FL0255]
MFRRGSSDSDSPVLSVDSYVAKLKPTLDDQFKQMMEEITLLENNRTVLRERKIQSHRAKKRDPSDTERRVWSTEQEADYYFYKAEVVRFGDVKKVQEASTTAAKKSKHDDLQTQETKRNQALKDDEAWLKAAVAAGTLRLGFMVKYPNCFNTASTARHLKAIEDTLNSAKLAVREIQMQKQKIADAAKIAARKAAASASRYAR